MSEVSQTEPFRECPKCGTSWASREYFLGDPCAELTGYQAHFEQPELGLLMFHHLGCCTTFGMPARQFADLYNGPMYGESLQDSERCNQFCTKRDELGRCVTKCKHAWVRELLQIVESYRKPSS